MKCMNDILGAYGTTQIPHRESKGVVILSGGMDSTTLLHLLVRHCESNVVALSFNYGQKHVRELECAKEQCNFLGVEHQIIELPFMSSLLMSTLLAGGADIPSGHYAEETMKQTVVPNRNMIMSSIAIGLAQSRKMDFLALGVHAGDHAIYPDCRKEFIAALDHCAQLSDWHGIRVLAPFQELTKKEIFEIGLSLKPAIDYTKTWTCYRGGKRPCGTCGSCTERDEAWKAIEGGKA